MSKRKCALSTFDLFRLDRACEPLGKAHHWATYLVGTAQTGPTYRDVDVRTILPDDEFDRIFPTEAHWQVACIGMTAWLQQQTGLPIDFQYQRMTEANALKGRRNPLGSHGRTFAGGGDATPRWTEAVRDE